MSDNILTIELSGSIDTYNSSDSERQIWLSIQESSADIIVLDVGKVNYMASTGVGALVNINKQCLKDGKKLYILGMTNKVKEVFSLLGFLSFFRSIDSIDEIEEDKESLFPIIIECPSCGKKLNVIKSGKFKCSSCKSELRVNKNAKLEK